MYDADILYTVLVGGVCSGIPAGAVVVWENPSDTKRENAKMTTFGRSILEC